MKVFNFLGMFLMGIRDASSFEWIKQILLYLDPLTKKVHPKSKQLFDSLKSSLIKIMLYIIIVPLFLENVVSSSSISLIFRLFYLILTYGYLFFYNTDVMEATRRVIAWKQKRLPNSNFQLDKIEKIQIFTKLSGKIKSFIFLLFYYLPIFLIEITVLLKIPFIGRILLIISQSFFNGTFYFLQNWNYDVFNVGYIQKNFSYMLGYGFLVSVICNLFLSGIYSTAAYLIISLWMLINSIVYSPPEIQFKDFNDIVNILKNYKQRKTYKNAYNLHRVKIRQNKQQRKELVNGIFLLYPALKITQFLNQRMSKMFQIKDTSIIQKQNKISSQNQQKQLIQSTKDNQINRNVILQQIKQEDKKQIIKSQKDLKKEQ